ncbi:MAG: S49 family peptidase [Tepidamorphaceae bacterium]|nr:S49 family peptidase [Rhodobiaceae bacterium]MCC0049470.1 S49 family peptidase [Rhodobiaceae bacterium]
MAFERLRALLPGPLSSGAPVVPVLRLAGPIGVRTSPFQQSLSLAGLAGPIKRLFSLKKAEAVAIVINSPGGSPVQSNLIFKRIRQLADENEKKVFVFVEDVAASGGYFIAVAGDEIIADPSSIVGSIGVVSASFGFVEAIGKIGVERRVHTAGEKKVMFDPFQPEKAEDVKRLKALQKDIHETFTGVVKSRRGDKLKGEEKDLFSGEFWTGNKALELGLIDRIGDLRSVLRAEYGDKVVTPVIPTQKRGFFGLGRAPSVGYSGDAIARAAANGLIEAVEERDMWARYGL